MAERLYSIEKQKTQHLLYTHFYYIHFTASGNYVCIVFHYDQIPIESRMA